MSWLMADNVTLKETTVTSFIQTSIKPAFCKKKTLLDNLRKSSLKSYGDKPYDGHGELI